MTKKYDKSMSPSSLSPAHNTFKGRDWVRQNEIERHNGCDETETLKA